MERRRHTLLDTRLLALVHDELLELLLISISELAEVNVI
jgi:hypothetical protein